MERVRQSGITLIALVVTIIVLLILAGVTIQMVIGQNGILSRAQEAKEKTEIAEYKEEMEVLLLDMQTESTLTGESDEDFLQRYKEKLEEMYGEDVTVEEAEGGSKLKVTTKEGYEFEVSTEGVEYKGKTGEVKPEPETEVKITYDNINWSRTKEVTIEAEGKEIEYAEGKEAYNSDSWTTYTNKLTITENNTVLYAKVKGTDKSKAKKEVIAKIDGVNPKEITLAKQSEEETTVEVKATATDGEATAISGQSGIKKFIFEIGIDEGNYSTPADGTKEVEASAIAEVAYTYTGLEEGHTYKLRVKAYDQAENEIILQEGGVVEVEKKAKVEVIPEEKRVGYYADIDDDGTVDGVIFADKAVGGSGTWNPTGTSSYNSNGTYTIPTLGNLKEYKVSEKETSDIKGGKYTTTEWGEKEVIVPVDKNDTTKNERFYVMALKDIDSSYHCWYDAAYDRGISSYSTVAPEGFGKGKTNTYAMINAWNVPSYGNQNDGSYTDMWGIEELQSKCYSSKNPSGKWFVPSREEWAAFGGELGIDKSNYPSKALSDKYWSSSLYSPNYAWLCTFYNGFIGSDTLRICYYVRLAATF